LFRAQTSTYIILFYWREAFQIYMQVPKHIL